MASPTTASAGAAGSEPRGPNTVFRELRGNRSPGEFAAAVRRAGREIGERVSCDARYIGRVESGEIRCPNYAYERVFLHMFPGRTLIDLGFAPRQAVRGRRGRPEGAPPASDAPRDAATRPGEEAPPHPLKHRRDHTEPEESDVLRRAFMTGGPAALAPLALLASPAAAAAAGTTPAVPPPGTVAGTAEGRRAGEPEAAALEEAVRTIRLLDDRHGADGLYRHAGASLRVAQELLDAGSVRQAVNDRLHSGAGELAISVGWLAHDSGRFADARSHYAEALATARMSGDAAVEAHAFCNTAFLARDTGRPREAVRAAQAGQHAARRLPSRRLRALLALREAGGWAGLGDRRACLEALGRARAHFDSGPAAEDPEWMSFFGEAEMASLEAQCWAALREYAPAVAAARRAVDLQEPHFVRNTALFTAELAAGLAAGGEPEEAAATAMRSLTLLEQVRSTRITGMLRDTAVRLRRYEGVPEVSAFRLAAS